MVEVNPYYRYGTLQTNVDKNRTCGKANTVVIVTVHGRCGGVLEVYGVLKVDRTRDRSLSLIDDVHGRYGPPVVTLGWIRGQSWSYDRPISYQDKKQETPLISRVTEKSQVRSVSPIETVISCHKQVTLVL